MSMKAHSWKVIRHAGNTLDMFSKDQVSASRAWGIGHHSAELKTSEYKWGIQVGAQPQRTLLSLGLP